MSKRVLSLFMALVLCFSTLPAAAFAEGGEEKIVSGGMTEGGGKYIADEAVADAASVTKADGTVNTFPTLQEALNAAADSDTVTLLADHTTNWSDVEAGEYSTLAVIKKTLTLDLNGKTIDYLEVGEMVPDEEGGILESTDGNLTVEESIPDTPGKIIDLDFVKGTLDIQGGVIGTDQSSTESDFGQLTCDENSGSVTISGGTVHGVTVGEGASVAVSGGSMHEGNWFNDGTLTITDGEFDSVWFRNNAGTVAISGGTFREITNKNASTNIPVMSLLAEGYAFYGKDADDAYTVVQDSRKTTLENVKVLEHSEHAFVNGTCIACGAVTCKEGGEGGCIAHVTILHYTWHIKTLDNIVYHLSSSGQWSSHYDTVNVEFLSDVTTDKSFCINQCFTRVTLDLNGHTISGELSGSPVAEVDFGYGTQRVIIQNGTIENTAENGTALQLSNGATTLEHMNVKGDLVLTSKFACSTNYTPTFLGGGTFTKICALKENGSWQKHLEDMLPKGYYFADITSGTRVPQIVLNTEQPLKNVTVLPCNHKDADGNYAFVRGNDVYHNYYCSICGNICPHANRKQNENGSQHCKNCGLDLGAVKIDQIDKTETYHPTFDSVSIQNKLYVTIKVLGDQSTSTAALAYLANGTIDLNGYTMTKLNDAQKLSYAYISNCLTFKNTAASPASYLCSYIAVNDTSGRLIIPAVDNNLTISAVVFQDGGTAELAGGSFGKISVTDGQTLASLLVSGYYFADSTTGKPAALYDADGTALTELTNVTVKPCSHDGSDPVYDPAEGVWKCPCGQSTFVANVTKGGATSLYTDLQEAFKAADGGTVKLMKNMDGDVTVNTDKPFILDLNGYDIFALTVNSKITIKGSAETKGRIIENLVVSSGMSIGELLEEGYAFRYVSTGAWCLGTWQTAGNISVQQAPIKSVTAANPTVTAEYGKTSEVTLTATVVPTAEGGTYSCQWYRVGGTQLPLEGAIDSTYQLPDDLAAGTYTYRLTAKADGYEKSCDFTVTVTPISITDATVEGTTTTYNGTEQAPTVTVKMGEKVLIENKDFTVDVTKQINVGSYKLTVIGKGGYNGKIENVDWKIEPMQLLSFCHVDSLTKTYDGTAAATLTKSAVKFYSRTSSFITLPEDAYDITNARFTKLQADKSYQDSPGVGSGKSISFTVTLKSDNYVLEKQPEQRVFDCTLATDNVNAFTITKASEPAKTADVSLYVTNGLAKTYELELKTLLPELTSPHEYGDITYGMPMIIMDADYYEAQSAKIENGKLILPILENPVDTQGKIGSVTVGVITSNYEEFSLSLDVFARNKIVPELDGTVSASDITYGQTLSESKLTVTGKMKDTMTTGEEVPGTFAWKDGKFQPEAGSYEAEWIFTPDEGYKEYAVATGTATIKVNKADLLSGVDYTAPTAKSGLEYDETQQELITSGATTIGTMEYKLGRDGVWSAEIPKAANAGGYEVYYKVLGDANHNDTAETLVADCAIAKMSIDYTVRYKTKVYDGTTDGVWESVKFMKWQDSYKVVELTPGEDFTVGKVNFKFPDAGVWIEGTSEVFLTESNRAKNYVIRRETVNSGGIIQPAPIENCHDMTVYIRYNDTSVHTYGAGGFGVSDDTKYDILTRGTEGSGYDIIDQLSTYGKITLKLKDNLTKKDIGKKCVTKVRIQTTDRNYSTDSDNKDTILFTVELVDRYTPVLSVEPITAVYDGSPISADTIKINGTTTHEGKEIAGTWSWEDPEHAPKNVGDSGEYTVVFTPFDQETYVENVTKKVDVTIQPKPISDVDSYLDKDRFTYNGGEQKPNTTVKMNGTDLTENTDYTVTYPTDMTSVGTKEIKVKGIGNFSGEKTVNYRIDKATVKVRPKNISKVYGDEPEFKLESESHLITEAELEKVAASAIFTSDGTAKTASVTAEGYVISAQLTGSENPDINPNLIFEIDGTGILTVEKADLTITVKDVSREYGAANPELEVIYSGFVNNEDESVLSGELILKYDESRINEQTAVGSHPNATTAEGLTSDNYNINYVEGNVDITKIKVNASAGTARRSYLDIVFDKSMEGLAAANFIVKDNEGNTVTVTNTTVSSDGKTYTLNGIFEVGKEYTVTVVLSGTATEATHQLTNDELVITPIRTSNDGGGSVSAAYTVSFDTNGGSELSKQTVTRNSVIKEPTAPTKDGFDFAGWYTDKELKENYDFSAKVTKSMTLYAAWTEKDNSENQIILTIGEKAAIVFGTAKTNDVAPKIVNDRTMLPARFVAENLGAEVSWDGEKELVTVKGKNLKTSEDITILIYIGSDIAYVNGKEIKLDSPAFIENDRTYTPIRFISEELGASVEWIEKEQKVIITK